MKLHITRLILPSSVREVGEGEKLYFEADTSLVMKSYNPYADVYGGHEYVSFRVNIVVDPLKRSIGIFLGNESRMLERDQYEIASDVLKELQSYFI